MDQDHESRLRQLLDKHAIEDVILRYARGIDRRERTLIESAFHPGAVNGMGETGQQLADYMLTMAENDPCYTHYICNQLIELDGPDAAYSETYFISVWELDRDGKSFTRLRGGRYIDRFERRNGEWRISSRVTADDWDRFDEIKKRARGLKSHAHEIGQDDRRGQAFPADLVYRMRGPG